MNCNGKKAKWERKEASETNKTKTNKKKQIKEPPSTPYKKFWHCSSWCMVSNSTRLHCRFQACSIPGLQQAQHWEYPTMLFWPAHMDCLSQHIIRIPSYKRQRAIETPKIRLEIPRWYFQDDDRLLLGKPTYWRLPLHRGKWPERKADVWW